MEHRPIDITTVYEKPKFRLHAPMIVFLALLFFTLLLNALAWWVPGFSDWYIEHIFPVWVETYGRLTGLFPFSVGEFLIVFEISVVVLAVLFGAFAGIRAIVGRFYRLSSHRQKKLSAFLKGYFFFFLWETLAVALLMTLNCYILYHATPFSQKYLGGVSEEYALEELLDLYNMVATECNSLSEQVERDENGLIVYPGAVLADGSVGDMQDKAREVIASLGAQYSQLSGYYPRPKALLSSDFMCQQYMLGYYFPFSMEANYNSVSYVMNHPVTMCHELSHLRGYIFEDEANFIAYLACVGSDDIYFRYSGYLSVLSYIVNDLDSAWFTNRELFTETAQKTGLVSIGPQVYEDDVFVLQEEWDRINGTAVVDTETVKEASDTFVDTNLKLNGVSAGKISYSYVVRLLMQYYRE